MCRTQVLSRGVAGSESGKWQESEDGEAFMQYGRLVLEEGRGPECMCRKDAKRESAGRWFQERGKEGQK